MLMKFLGLTWAWISSPLMSGDWRQRRLPTRHKKDSSDSWGVSIHCLRVDLASSRHYCQLFVWHFGLWGLGGDQFRCYWRDLAWSKEFTASNVLRKLAWYLTFDLTDWLDPGAPYWSWHPYYCQAALFVWYLNDCSGIHLSTVKWIWTARVASFSEGGVTCAGFYPFRGCLLSCWRRFARFPAV